MKRSKMVRNMTEYWLGLLPNENPANMGYEEGLFQDVEEKMGSLLNFLEHSGMTPPFHSETFYKTWRDNGNGHVWEPEND